MDPENCENTWMQVPGCTLLQPGWFVGSTGIISAFLHIQWLVYFALHHPWNHQQEYMFGSLISGIKKKSTWKLLVKFWNMKLGGGFKYFLFSSLFGEDSILTNIFQKGWNHQPVVAWWTTSRINSNSHFSSHGHFLLSRDEQKDWWLFAVRKGWNPTQCYRLFYKSSCGSRHEPIGISWFMS